MNTRICIIRHGETDWNRQRRIQGQIDIPLNETGRAQALAMAFNAAHHSFSAIYSSDLSRALDTAKMLGEREQHEIKVVPQLRERHYGMLQNVVKENIATQYPEANEHYLSRNLHYNFENGESLLTFSQRVLDIFNWIVRHHENQQVAVVCHAGVLDIMYRKATNLHLEKARDFVIPNCALNWFHYDGENWHLDRWDDHHHLRNVLLESVE